MSCSDRNRPTSKGSGSATIMGWRSTLTRWTQVGLAIGAVVGASTLPAAALATSIISGVKFNDLNNNAVQDPGEKGFAAEVVYIRNDTLANANKGGYYTTYTDMEGRYRLTGLPVGKYTVWTGVKEPFWQTSPVLGYDVGLFEQFYTDLPDNRELVINFGLWDGVERPNCTLCVLANDQQTDAREEVKVGGYVIDNSPDGSDLTLTVEAFGYTSVKTVAAIDRVAAAKLPIELAVSFPKGGEYPVKVTAISDNGAKAEGTGRIIVRDAVTTHPCDVKAVNVWSTRSGDWKDADVWSTGRVPNRSDWVKISSGHSVRAPAITTSRLKNDELRVRGLCVDYGTNLNSVSYRQLKTPPANLVDKVIVPKNQKSGTRGIEHCAFGMTRNLKTAKNPCVWNDPTSWDPNGDLTAQDSLFVPAGVSCVIPPNANQRVGVLCNEGTLQSPSGPPPADGQQYWLAINARNFHNRGTIVSSDGALGRGPGVGIALTVTGKFQNEGVVRSGNGGYSGGDYRSLFGGNGGPVRIDTADLSNSGTIQTGNGGVGLYAFLMGSINGGNGGQLTITGTGECESTSQGRLQTGNGGTTQHGAGGFGGSAVINCTGLSTRSVIFGSNALTIDPIHIKLDIDTRLNSENITIFGDDDGKIEVGNLAEGAVTAEKTLTWAVGKGGIIDFSQVSNKAFKAGEEMIVYTDNLILPPGKTLAQLVDAPKVTLQPAKLLMYASWFSSEETMIGEPAETLLLPLTLDNLGPAKDTYTLTVSNPQDWAMCTLPKTVTVNSQRNVKLECPVILPLSRGAANTVTVTATSQTDPSLQVTTTLHLKVALEVYDLYGKVLDPAGQPLAEATVQIGEQTTTTDAQGQWMLMDLPVGEHQITVTKAGYTFPSQSVTVNAETAVFTLQGELQSSSVDDGLIITDATHTLEIQPAPGPETELQVVDNGDGTYTATNGLTTMAIKPQGSGTGDELTIITGQNLTDTKAVSSTKVVPNPDGSYSLIDAQSPNTALTLHPDGTAIFTDTEEPNLSAALNEDGSISVLDETAPGIIFTAMLDGTATATNEAFPGVIATYNAEGNTVVTDASMPELSMTFDQTGQVQITDLHSGMSATRDAQGIYTVHDPENPDWVSIVNPMDGSVQVIDNLTGQCLTADTADTGDRGSTRGLWDSIKKVTQKAVGFVNNAFGVVAKASGFVNTVANVVNVGANWLLNKAPVINNIATTVQNWAFNKASTASTSASCWFFCTVASLAGKVANITAPGSSFLGFVTKTANISKTVLNVSNALVKLPTTLSKVVSTVKSWFKRSGQRSGESTVLATSDCPLIALEKGPYSAFGTVKDKLGTVAGVTVQIGSQTALTDAQGQWEIVDLVAGNYTAEAYKEGYLSVIQQFEVGQALPKANVPLKLASLLKLQISAQPKLVKPGDNITYVLNVTNNGPKPATGVRVQDVIPEGTTLLSVDGENCDLNSLSCHIAELAAHQTAKIKVMVNAPDTGRLENTATVTASNYPLDQVTNVKEVIPVLSVSTQCTPNPVPMLESLECITTVNLQSTAPTPATGVKVVSTLPTGVKLHSVTTDFGSCKTDQLPTLTCELSELSNDNLGNQATIHSHLILQDAGLLALTQETTVSAENYAQHSSKVRNKILIPATIQADLAMVVDITGSMQGEIDGTKAALKQFIATLDPASSPLMALIVFKDEVTVKAFTKDMNVLLKAVEGLKAEGGGTCPEASAEAVEVATLHVRPGGQIWFTTDASPYPDANVQAVLDLLQAKNIRFHATVTGDCADGNSANDNEFAQAVNQ